MIFSRTRKRMRATIVKRALLLALSGWCASVSATVIFDYSGSATAIPDGDGNGTTFNFSYSGPITSIDSDLMTVTLNISGGWNGDLYVYLVHGAGQTVLLNRTGVGTTSGGTTFGYANTGFNVTFDGTAANNIHFYQSSSPTFNGSGQLTGTWQPDGRTIDPSSTPSAFNAAGAAPNFSTFEGLDPNGSWTLFVADLSGGNTSTLTDFSVDVTPVPEPINSALVVFACLASVSCLFRSRHFGKMVRRGDGR